MRHIINFNSKKSYHSRYNAKSPDSTDFTTRDRSKTKNKQKYYYKQKPNKEKEKRKIKREKTIKKCRY